MSIDDKAFLLASQRYAHLLSPDTFRAFLTGYLREAAKVPDQPVFLSPTREMTADEMIREFTHDNECKQCHGLGEYFYEDAYHNCPACTPPKEPKATVQPVESTQYLVVVTGDFNASYIVSRVEGVIDAYAEYVLGEVTSATRKEAFEACADMNNWTSQDRVPFSIHHSFEDGSFSAYRMPNAPKREIVAQWQPIETRPKSGDYWQGAINGFGTPIIKLMSDWATPLRPTHWLPVEDFPPFPPKQYGCSKCSRVGYHDDDCLNSTQIEDGAGHEN